MATETQQDAFSSFQEAVPWDPEAGDGILKRNQSKWTSIKRLLNDRQWLLGASPDQRLSLHSYLCVLASSGTAIETRLEALTLGLEAGLLSRTACRWYVQLLLPDRGASLLSPSDLYLVAQWICNHGMMDDAAVQDAVAHALCQLDQDDRQKLLDLLLGAAPITPAEGDKGFIACFAAMWEHLVRFARLSSRSRADAMLGQPTIGSNRRAGISSTEDMPAPSLFDGAYFDAPLSPERVTKALHDARTRVAAWLARHQGTTDVTLVWRLVRAALYMWTPPPRGDTTIAVRALVEERQATTLALLRAVLSWPLGADVMSCVLMEPGIATGAYLAALEACWSVDNQPLYGRLARRLLQTTPAAASYLCRNTLPLAQTAARYTAILTAPAGNIDAARPTLEKLVLECVRDMPEDQRPAALALLAVVESGAMGTDTRVKCAGIREAIYTSLLSQVDEGELPGNSDAQRVPVDAAFYDALRGWVDAREADAVQAATARDAATREDNVRLEQELRDVRADLASVQRMLEETRALGRAQGTDDSITARLPVLRRLAGLADDVDRLLAAGQGDYETLAALREYIHEILAEQGVQVMGEIGERTRFDAEMHEYVGERGAEHEWYEILESGYVVLLPDRATVVLKRIQVRPLQS